MKRVIVFSVLLFSFIFSLPAGAHSEALRWGVVVNYSKNQCGAFWEGDECVRYIPKPGWEPFFPSYDAAEKSNKITLAGKSCLFRRGQARFACECLGYEYIKKPEVEEIEAFLSDDPSSPCAGN